MNKVMLLLIGIFSLSACSTAWRENGLKGLQQNNLAYAACVVGSGPPLTGEGENRASGS